MIYHYLGNFWNELLHFLTPNWPHFCDFFGNFSSKNRIAKYLGDFLKALGDYYSNLLDSIYDLTDPPKQTDDFANLCQNNLFELAFMTSASLMFCASNFKPRTFTIFEGRSKQKRFAENVHPISFFKKYFTTSK